MICVILFSFLASLHEIDIISACQRCPVKIPAIGRLRHGARPEGPGRARSPLRAVGVNQVASVPASGGQRIARPTFPIRLPARKGWQSARTGGRLQ